MFTSGNTSSTPATARAAIKSFKNSFKKKNKTRFSDQQIRSLESMFEAESRPELPLKQQLANELGLQPRQVAIWFQNKRARTKSRQIEQEYGMLKINYDNLASRFESLKKESQSLHSQLQRLRSLMGKRQGSRTRWLRRNGKGQNEQYEKRDTMLETAQNPNFILETCNHDTGMPFCNDNCKSVRYFGEETYLLNKAELAHGSLTSTDNGCSLDSSNLLDNLSCGSQWWEF